MCHLTFSVVDKHKIHVLETNLSYKAQIIYWWDEQITYSNLISANKGKPSKLLQVPDTSKEF